MKIIKSILSVIRIKYLFSLLVISLKSISIVHAGCVSSPLVGQICYPDPTPIVPTPIVVDPFPYTPPFYNRPFNVPDTEQPEETGEPENCVGNPCDPLTGNKYQVEVDGYGGVFSDYLIRYYNSLNADVDLGLGYGWSSEFTKRLEFEGDDNVLVYRENGYRERLEKVGSHYVGNKETQFRRMVTVEDGYRLDLLNGHYEQYSLSGLLKSENRNGYTLTYHYSNGKLSYIKGSYGHRLDLSYQGNRIVLIKLSDKSYTYNYDALGNLIKVVYPDNHSRGYKYGNTNYPSHLTGIVDERGIRYASYEYNDQGKAILTEHAQTGNGLGQNRYRLIYQAGQTTTIDAKNENVVYQYNTNRWKQRLSKISYTDGKQWQFSYDNYNNLKELTDPNGAKTGYSYNGYNLLTKRVDAKGTNIQRETSLSYLSSSHNLVDEVSYASIQPGKTASINITYNRNYLPNKVRITGYDSSGSSIEREIKYRYSDTGQLTAIDGAREDTSDITQFEYNDCSDGGACGQLQRKVNALGYVTDYTGYDELGRLTQIRDSNGVQTNYTYTPRGFIKSIAYQLIGNNDYQRLINLSYTPFGELSKINYGNGLQVNYVYNEAMELVKINDSEGNQVIYGYDKKGNIIERKMIDSNGQLSLQSNIKYDLRDQIQEISQGGLLSKQIYDAVGNLRQLTDGKSQSEQGIYDKLNRLTQVTDRISGTINVNYDKLDRVTQLTTANNAKTQYEYDDLGNIVKQESSDRGIIGYKHDKAGNVIEQTDDKNTLSFNYDNLNRLIKITSASGDIAYSYDRCTFGLNQLCQIKHNADIIKYSYTPLGEIASENHNGEVISYGYDSYGALLEVTYPSTRKVRYKRDDLNQILSVSVSIKEKNELGELEEKQQNLYESASYGADGRWRERDYGNGVQGLREYAPSGLIVKQKHSGVDYLVYDYDANGNMINQTNELNYYYNYDSLDRLKNESGDYLQQYTYDGNGNLTNREDVNYNYQSQSNRIDTQNYKLNEIGQLVQKGDRNYQYDAYERLLRISENTNLIEEYHYNGLHQRRGKNNTTYYYDNSHRILAENQQGKWKDYIYDDEGLIAYIEQIDDEKTSDAFFSQESSFPEIDELEASQSEEAVKQTKQENTTQQVNILPMPCLLLLCEDEEKEYADALYWVYTDHLGSAYELVDQHNQVHWRWQSAGYGSQLANEGVDGDGAALTFNIRYPGHYYDSDSNLHYNIHRYYEPQTGRYISSDPIGLAGGLNSYAYAHNNPLTYIDRDGQFAVPLVFIGLGAGAFIYDEVNFNNAIDNGDFGSGEIVQSSFPDFGLGAIGLGASKFIGRQCVDDVINVTKSGVALPLGLKYKIPENYIQNPYRQGSYGEIVDGKFNERLRIDSPTPPNKKGPNYSHYHKDGKGGHYSPRLNDKDPGF